MVVLKINWGKRSICLLRNCIGLVLLFVTCSLGVDCRIKADEISNPLSSEIEKTVAATIRTQNIPGMSIAIGIGESVAFAKGYGLADVENDVPVTATTRFRTASIAKPMTAAVILSLVEDGLVDLDCDILEYCPEFPRKKWPITVRQLLGHLAGIRHYKTQEETHSTARYGSLDEALAVFRDDPLVHEPGTKYLYTTFGYNLLGCIAENAGQQSFSSLLEQRVWQPAGMTDSMVDSQAKIIPGRSRGYAKVSQQDFNRKRYAERFESGDIINAELHDTSMKIPGGGLLSTPSDLVRFAMALPRSKLFSQDLVSEMWTAQTIRDGDSTGYGLGWRIDERRGHRAVWHTGGQAGTSTVLMIWPDVDLCVAVMSNLQGARLVALAENLLNAIAHDRATSKMTAPSAASSKIKLQEAALAKLDAAIKFEVKQKSLPAFSIALVDGQATIFSAGYGFEDKAQEQQATADTLYRVGSVSKLFTDIAVMQQLENGSIDYDVPVQTYVPNFAAENTSGKDITLRHLMTHRSGLVREPPIGNYFDPSEPSLRATVASLSQTKLTYPPDSRAKYSNAALAVVGLALENVTGKSQPDLVRDSILKPLSMNSSTFLVPDIDQPVATGWMWTYDGRRFEAPTFQLGTGPAGNLYSTVNDLAKFLKLINGKGKSEDQTLLSAETLVAMLEPNVSSDGKSQGYGLGFRISNLDGTKKVGHGGAVYGFSTQIELLPSEEIGVAAACSLDGVNGLVTRLAEYALRLQVAVKHGLDLPDYETTVELPPERGRLLKGRFASNDSESTIEINELGGTTTLLSKTFKHTLRARSTDGEIVVDSPFQFGTSVESIDPNTLKIGDEHYTRMPAAVPASPPERWEGLIGEYGWDHNTLYVLERNGQLYVLIEWFYYYPLAEVTENEFAFPDYGLYHGEQVIFHRDASNRATEVVVAGVPFPRRELGAVNGKTFQITPVRPIDSLRASAAAAKPPEESGDFLESDLVELIGLDPTLHLDIRYASTNNFTGAVFYKQPRAFMQRSAAIALAGVNAELSRDGLGLLVHDAYRPWYVTKMFWEATPNDMKDFVANPANGSRHNRGCAVDITFYDLKSGQPIDMVAGYDEFSHRSYPDYPGGTQRQRYYRDFLRQSMEKGGFDVYEFEWWHFDYKDWRKYRIGNSTFEQLIGTD